MATYAAIENALATLAHCILNQPAPLLQEGGMAIAIEIWKKAVADLDDQELEDAIMGYLRGGSAFWPTPGQVLHFAPGRRAKAISDAGEAWGEILQLAGNHGRNNPPGERWQLSAIPDKNKRMLSGLKAVGGWRALCDSHTRDHTAHRAAFRKEYESRGEWMEVVREDHLIENATSNVMRLEDKKGDG
mgnify:CR=1 FL=1